LDDGLLVDRLEKLRADKRTLLSGLMAHLDCPDEESVRKKLASNPQFAKILTDLGIDPPMKTSPATGKQTFAFAKNDIGFIELAEHENPLVQQLCAVRLGTKSTIEESRVGRFIEIGARNRGKLPIPLKYYGAHTGRWSGIDGLNLHNLPSRDKDKKSLKKSIVAPPGHVVINCDSSQIEARVLAWLAGQTDLVAQFANGEDVYSQFASKIYGQSISKENPVERFVGKTCVLGLGYGTGAVKLQHTLKTQPPGADLSEEECKRIVTLYRSSNHKIPEFWKDCEYALNLLLARMNNPEVIRYPSDNGSILTLSSSGIGLPNGLFIRYPGLKLEDKSYVYESRKGPVKLWGGSVTENIVQALARIVVAEQMLAISSRYRVVLTVHDAAVIVVPESEQDDARRYMEQCMTTPPQWAPTLPVACESKIGGTYGDC
jgi:DNA polymerase